MQLLSAILAILEAIPILDKWFTELTLAYAAQQRSKGNADFQKAMDTAIKDKDTTDLQSSIGSKLN